MQKGFTLIELLVVVAIMGVLAAITLPNIGQFMGAADDVAKDTELRTISMAVMTIMVSTGENMSATGYTNDMDQIHSMSGSMSVSQLVTGLNADNTTKSGCSYSVNAAGTVDQSCP